jgi:hypothetical protein
VFRFLYFRLIEFIAERPSGRRFIMISHLTVALLAVCWLVWSYFDERMERQRRANIPTLDKLVSAEVKLHIPPSLHRGVWSYHDPVSWDVMDQSTIGRLADWVNKRNGQWGYFFDTPEYPLQVTFRKQEGEQVPFALESGRCPEKGRAGFYYLVRSDGTKGRVDHIDAQACERFISLLGNEKIKTILEGHQ